MTGKMKKRNLSLQDTGDSWKSGSELREFGRKILPACRELGFQPTCYQITTLNCTQGILWGSKGLPAGGDIRDNDIQLNLGLKSSFNLLPV